MQAVKEDDNEDVRRIVIEALGNIRDVRMIGLLIHALSDKDAEIRWRAIEALGNTGDSRAIESLIRALQEDDNEDV